MPTSIEVKPNAFLADVLRYQLGLTGTKIGCQEAECGICTVLVNGTPVNSCIYPAVKANGAPYTQWFSRYKMPSIRHTPEIVSFIVKDPVAEGPYGAKGVGEIASIPTTRRLTHEANVSIVLCLDGSIPKIKPK